MTPAEPFLPPLVARAERIASARAFTNSCARSTGRLLHVLAGRRGLARVAEIGTGAGVGAAWVVSALSPDVPFVTVEVDTGLAAGARALFSDDPGVTVLAGDWRSALPVQAPFDFLFVGARDAKDDPDAVLALAVPGALVVLDDFSAPRVGTDPGRERWLGHDRVNAALVDVGAGSLVLLATVRR